MRAGDEWGLGERFYISLCLVTLINYTTSVIVPTRVNVNVLHLRRSE